MLLSSEQTKPELATGDSDICKAWVTKRACSCTDLAGVLHKLEDMQTVRQLAGLAANQAVGSLQSPPSGQTPQIWHSA